MLCCPAEINDFHVFKLQTAISDIPNHSAKRIKLRV